jgi:hypothetical protein
LKACFNRAVRAIRAARLAVCDVVRRGGVFFALFAFAVAELCVDFFSVLLGALVVDDAAPAPLVAGVGAVVCAAAGNTAISQDRSIAVTRRVGGVSAIGGF